MSASLSSSSSTSDPLRSAQGSGSASSQGQGQGQGAKHQHHKQRQNLLPHRATLSLARPHAPAATATHQPSRFSLAPSLHHAAALAHAPPLPLPSHMALSRNLNRPSYSSLSLAPSSAPPRPSLSQNKLINAVRSSLLRASSSTAPSSSSLPPSRLTQTSRHTLLPSTHRATAIPVSPYPLPPILADPSRKSALPPEFASFYDFHERAESFVINLHHALGIARDNLRRTVHAAKEKDGNARDTLLQLQQKLATLRTHRAAAAQLRSQHAQQRTQLTTTLDALHAANQALRADRDATAARTATLESHVATHWRVLKDRAAVHVDMVRKTRVLLAQYAKLLGMTITPLPDQGGTLFEFDHVLPKPARARLHLQCKVATGTWECVECVPALPKPLLDRLVAELVYSRNVARFVRKVRTAWVEGDAAAIGGSMPIIR